jgi:hypothetical protein
MTITASQFHTKLVAAAVARPEIRRHTRGQKGHQGDVYCHPVTSRPTAWSRATPGRQVAVGDTVGSRHVADGEDISVYWPVSQDTAMAECPIPGFAEKLGGPEIARQCLGPIVVARKEWTLVHPEHAHHVFPAGTYLITYQLDRRTMRVVRD